MLDHALTGVEHEFVPAAEAMPDDKFNFAPTQGISKACGHLPSRSSTSPRSITCSPVRSFRKSHQSSLGSENGPDNITSKADVVKFLKDSFAYLHKALNTIDENNVLGQVPSPFGTNKISRLGLATIAISHPFDHYGQMVEYLRMNNIIPPASRAQ